MEIMKEIYQYDDYKKYLVDALMSLGHGSRLKFAEALKCQPAYVSQVLNQHAHLSLEQGVDASGFFNLDRDEEDYFLNMLQLAKAGTTKLKNVFESKIQAMRERRAQLSNRVTGTEELDEVTQARYYSRWYYAAIHILVTVPSYRNKESMSKYLGISLATVNEALEFLQENGLVVSGPAGFTTGRTRVFLKGDAPAIVQHHQNWRLRAMDSFISGKKENVHFSSVYSLSHQDFIKIKEKLLTQLQEVREIVKPSKEEEVCVLNLDFFSLEKS
jgi:uncharacterized protein (TIGR02147 family)